MLSAGSAKVVLPAAAPGVRFQFLSPGPMPQIPSPPVPPMFQYGLVAAAAWLEMQAKTASSGNGERRNFMGVGVR